MKHYRFLIAALALTTLLAACSDKENEPYNADGRIALSIHANIRQNADAATRADARSLADAATRADDTDWQSNDAIGIIMLDAGTTTVTEGKTNYKYLTATGNGTFAPDGKEQTAYFPTNSVPVDILAYYPYTTAVNARNLRIPVDVSRQDNLPAIDLMTPDKKAECSAKQPEVTLAFNHRLCKLILQVVTDETTAGIDLNNAQATLNGTTLTAEWDLTTGKLTPKGKASPLALPMTAAGTRATAIVMPAAAGAGKSITLTTTDGKAYTAEIADNLPLEAGTVNTYTMTLQRNQASITASIRPWTEGTNASLHTLHIDLPADGTADGLTTFQMWRNQSQVTDTRTYTFDATNKKWTATPSPFYIEEIEPTDALYALHTPADTEKDPVTGLKDLIAAGPETLKDYSVRFSFAHLMSQLNIILNRSSDFPEGTSLEGATITLPPMTSAYTLDGITLTPADTQKDTYPALPVKDGKTETLLVLPQTLPEGSSFTVRLGDKTYTGILTASTTLLPGKKNVLTLTLQATRISIGVIDVEAWEEGNSGSGNADADGIIPASASLAGIKEAGILSLNAYKPGNTTPATDKPGTYPVTYDAGNGSAAIDINAASYSPILWDNLPKYFDDDAGTLQNYAYAATYVPTGYILTGKTASAANTERHEKDLLGNISISVPTPWGIAPDFVDTNGNGISNADTRLKHLMARFTVKLTCIDGTYTAAQLNAATLTTVRKATADTAAPLAVSNTGVALKTVSASGDANANTVTLVKTADATNNGTADTDNIAQYSAILAPQTLTAAETDVVLRLSITGAASPKEYSLKKAVTLEAGKDNVLTARLTQTELNIGEITVKEWDDSTKGEGDFEM